MLCDVYNLLALFMAQWYEEVRSWTVPGYACRPSLARFSGASEVQTRDDGV